MWKFNKYNIGDIVAHKEAPILELQVCNILYPYQKNQIITCTAVNA